MLKKLVFVAMIAFSVAPSARAQIKAEHPRFCVMSVGPTQMMFSAFQENKTDGIFCQHVPELGPTMVILDARQEELRDMNIEVRVLRNVGQKDWREDLEANTLAYLPPKKYLERRGTMNFTSDFAKEGDFFALVRATSDDGAKEYVGRYDFSVGETSEWALATGVLAGALAFGALGMWRRRGGKLPPQPSEAAKPAGSAARQTT
jgi:hypothetical protein